MRTVHWLFVVSVALFVSGIGFLIASARTGTAVAAAVTMPVAPVAPVVPVVPVASVKQIMQGIVAPAARVVFQSVSTTITASGIEEHAPRNDQEWEAVENGAAALVESGNLLLLGDRALDRGDWLTMSLAMMEAGQVALKAVEAKDAEAVLASGEAITFSCDNCHVKYQR